MILLGASTCNRPASSEGKHFSFGKQNATYNPQVDRISSLSATREPEFGSLWALEGTEVRWIPNASGQSTQKQIKDANRSEIEFLNLALQSSMKQLNAGDNYLHCIVKGRLLSIELGIVSLSIQCEQVV